MIHLNHRAPHVTRAKCRQYWSPPESTIGKQKGARALGAGTSSVMRSMTVDWEEKKWKEIPGRGNTMDKGVSRVPGTMGIRSEGFRMTDEGRNFSNHGLG